MKKLALRLGLMTVVALLLTVGSVTVSFVMPQVVENYVRANVGTEVVKIVGVGGTGSGFYIKYKDKNLIVTNKHVCQLKTPDDQLWTIDYGKDTKVVRKVLILSEEHDLCLLTGDENNHGLSVSDKQMEIGTKSYLVGHPTGQPLTVSYGTYIGDKTISMAVPTPVNTKYGIVYLPFLTDFETNQFHQYARPGSSGSPITDIYGNVVAVLFAGINNDSFKSFGVPSRFLVNLIKKYDEQTR